MRVKTSLVRLLTAAAIVAVLSVTTIQVSEANAPLSAIKVSFKLDPRLTKSLYMGDRWVSPRTYTRVGTASAVTIEARAAGVNAKRKTVDINATWTVVDPEMATVTPSQGSEVTITVVREGQSDLVVTSDDVSRKMVIKCVQKGGVWQVQISQ